MNFNNIFSEWKNKGNEPSSDLKNNGFQPGYKPPANIFNWFWSKVIAAITELQNKLSQTDKQSNGILTNTIYDNTSSSGYQITITVPNLSDDPFEKDNENSLDGKIIAVSMKNYTATSDNANMKLNVNTKSTDLWHYPKGKSGDTGRVHSFKAYEIRPQSVLLIAIKDHYGYVLNPPSPLKLDGKISDNTENDVDYITGKLAADYAAEFNRFVGSNAYAVDISKVNKVGYNQALCIEIPGITEWSDLNGKVIAVTTGAYCWTGKNADNKTPDKLYLRVNDSTLDDKIQNTIKRQIPSYTGVDYDTDNEHIYFTDYYMPGEIARYQTLFIGFRDTDIMLLNPAPAPRATKAIEADSTDDISYVTPKIVTPLLKNIETNTKNIKALNCASNVYVEFTTDVPDKFEIYGIAGTIKYNFNIEIFKITGCDSRIGSSSMITSNNIIQQTLFSLETRGSTFFLDVSEKKPETCTYELWCIFENNKNGNIYYWDKTLEDEKNAPQNFINLNDNTACIYLGTIYLKKDTSAGNNYTYIADASELKSYKLPWGGGYN